MSCEFFNVIAYSFSILAIISLLFENGNLRKRNRDLALYLHEAIKDQHR